MFARKTSDARMHTSVNYDVHPWVADALLRSDSFVANPGRPICMSFDSGTLVTVPASKGYRRNDVLWVSFTLTFVVGPDNWGPEHRPIDVIRVGQLSGIVGTRVDISAIPEVDRKALVPGKISLPPKGKSCICYKDLFSLTYSFARSRTYASRCQ